MKMTMYRQATKVRDGGLTVYKGEDALPYVGENFFVVADGMGGAGAIRHTSFNREIFDEDKIFDVMFKDALPDADDEIVDYVKKAFFELYAVKDCYFDSAYNMKKSGYFGSRICAASLMYYIKKLLASEDGKDLKDLHSASDEVRAEKVKKLGDYFTENIKSSMVKVSENANLIYETAFLGLALLGTTVCGTIFFERDDEVDAIYLVAGDSRPFQWDESGLKLVVEDQKRDDGGMTNYVKANGDFTISASFHTFKKPCVLFNASDGVYESAQFYVSEVGLEKLLLETVCDSEDTIGLKNKLEELYLEYGTHDDSSTIALNTFGYEGYEDLKNAASKRLKEIVADYFDKMPDFLQIDYIAMVENAKKAEKIRQNAISAELLKFAKVSEYCKGKVTGPDKTEEIKSLESQLAEKKSESEEIGKQIVDFLCKNVGVTDNGDDDGDKCGASLNNNEKFCLFRKIRRISENEAKELAGRLINKEIMPDKMGIGRTLSNKLIQLLEANKSAEDEIAANEKKLENEVKTAGDKYWANVTNENDDITAFCLNEGLISKEEADKLNEKYPSKGSVDEETERKAALQCELREKYDAVFYSLIKEKE